MRGDSMKLKSKLIIGSSAALVFGPVITNLLNDKKDDIKPSSKIPFNLNLDLSDVTPSSHVDPNASIIGEVQIGRNVFVGPFASIRGDEGNKIHIGDGSNVQDGAVLHGLINLSPGSNIAENTIFDSNKAFSIYIAQRVTLAQQCQVHGPCRIDSDVFVGMQSLVFRSYIGEGTVLEPGCKVIDVVIPKNRYVPAGQVVATQASADALPEITPGYKYYNFNQKVVDASIDLTKGYANKSNIIRAH
jgi:carbonic anhydrase